MCTRLSLDCYQWLLEIMFHHGTIIFVSVQNAFDMLEVWTALWTRMFPQEIAISLAHGQVWIFCPWGLVGIDWKFGYAYTFRMNVDQVVIPGLSNTNTDRKFGYPTLIYAEVWNNPEYKCLDTRSPFTDTSRVPSSHGSLDTCSRWCFGPVGQWVHGDTSSRYGTALA